MQGQKFFRDLNTAEWPNPACFFQGTGSVDMRTGLARPVLCAEAHGKGNTSQAEVLQGKQVCSADWGRVKQSDTNLQTNSKMAEVHSKELKQAGWLQYYWQEWNRLTQDNERL